MRVGEAKDAARRWLAEEATAAPVFRGAYLHGSTAQLPDDAALPATSDLDVIFVLAAGSPPPTTGKVRYRGVLLDVSALPEDELRSPAAVLGRYRLANGLRAPGILADPTGRLAPLQAAVAEQFAQRRWVRARVEDAEGNLRRFLRSLREGSAAPFPDQVSVWLFATGVMSHLPLVAGLENPTVRRRYLAARDLLAAYGHTALYDTLLESLGCARMDRAQADRHLVVLGDAFDAARGTVTTPFAFASDLSDLARPIAIDGSRELIARGDHREAVFWLVATYSRCMTVFHADAPGLRDRFEPGYRRLLGDLGIVSAADLLRRADWVEASLPRIREVAEAIMAANPGIQDEPPAAGPLP